MKIVRTLCLAAALASTLAGCGTSQKSATATNAQPGGGTRRDDSLERVKKAGTLAWGADVVGGVPYVYEDPKHPGQYVGFEKEIAEEVARSLGVELKLVVKAWDTLIPELQRGSYDMAMNGIEDTEERGKIVEFSSPYYVYSQQLTVRRGTKNVTGLDDLKGHKVGTLSGTAAEDLLRQHAGIDVVVNPEVIYSYRDLSDGKVDAVLLDKPIAVAYGASNPKLQNVGESFQEGRYVIAFRKGDESLRLAVNAALDEMKRNGKLKAIYAKYGIMDAHQAKIGLSL
jgi:polar amino acid transport system substrate-binding protein